MRYEPKKPHLVRFSSIKIGDEFEVKDHLYKKIPLVGSESGIYYYNAVCLNCLGSPTYILREFPGDSLVRPVAGLFKEV